MNKVRLENDEITYEKIVSTNRVAKVVKGGRNFSFNAIVVVGNQNGVVGVGSGKANEITDAIRKARNKAVGNTFRVPIVRGTIPHEVKAKYGPSKLLIRPASEGTGLIAGGTPRALFEAAGIHNILAKSMGSNTPCNLVKATVVALTELRTLSQVAKLRGKTFDQLCGKTPGESPVKEPEVVIEKPIKKFQKEKPEKIIIEPIIEPMEAPPIIEIPITTITTPDETTDPSVGNAFIRSATEEPTPESVEILHAVQNDKSAEEPTSESVEILHAVQNDKSAEETTPESVEILHAVQNDKSAESAEPISDEQPTDCHVEERNISEIPPLAQNDNVTEEPATDTPEEPSAPTEEE